MVLQTFRSSGSNPAPDLPLFGLSIIVTPQMIKSRVPRTSARWGFTRQRAPHLYWANVNGSGFHGLQPVAQELDLLNSEF